MVPSGLLQVSPLSPSSPAWSNLAMLLLIIRTHSNTSRVCYRKAYLAIGASALLPIYFGSRA